MTNNHLPSAFATLLLLAALAAPAYTAEREVPSPTGEREFGAKMLVCNACHGDNGVPKSPNIPVIAGQQDNYLLKQLHDFDTGARNFEIMTWMATTLTPEEQAQAATYFAKKSWPARTVTVAAATPPATAAVCQVCHQQNFVGGVTAPRLAGQSYEYLVEAMRRYASGERTNSTDMTRIMEAISPADREAMARYIAGL
jgi:cytochrome c553